MGRRPQTGQTAVSNERRLPSVNRAGAQPRLGRHGVAVAKLAREMPMPRVAGEIEASAPSRSRPAEIEGRSRRREWMRAQRWRRRLRRRERGGGVRARAALVFLGEEPSS